MKKINLRQWLKNIDDERELLSLSIPGTHDASAFFINIRHFACCQNSSIYEQLNLGVRALDLRVKPIDNDTLGMVHGICTARSNPSYRARQLELGDVLKMCYNFLNMNSSEAIILQFKNDDGMNQERCFDILYRNYISKHPERWFTENRSPKLSEVRGKIVLLRRCKKSDKYDTDNSGIDFSSWSEQGDITPEPLPLLASDDMKFVIQDRYKYKPEEKWDKAVKPFLDSMSSFNGEYVINYLSTAGGLKGPQKNAEYVNSQFFDYPLDSEKYYGIIYIDFPTPDMTRKIINTNLREEL